MSTEPQLPAERDPSMSGAEEQKISLEPPELPSAPDGGLRAWLAAAGGASVFFCCLGVANSFGTFEEYYLRNQLEDYSPDAVAWIGSLSLFLQFFSGVIGGPLFDRYGAKTLRPAAVIYVFAIMMLSLCTQYWHFMLVQGVLMGIMMGFLQFPALAAVAQYFDKKRAAAIGIVVSGSSIGGIITPIAVSRMLNGSDLGFGWSVRIIGFLVTPLIFFACVVVTPRLPSRKSSFFIMTAFKDLKFHLLYIALFFMFGGVFVPLFFIPTYAVSRGMDAALAGYLLAVVNAASTFGRIIPGVLADKYGRLNILALGGISSGIVAFCMNSATTNAALIVYAIVFGLVSGTVVSGASVAFSMCVKDARDLGTMIGMGMSISAVGGLIGPPINGALVKAYGGFFEASMFSGAMCVVGGFVAVAIKLVLPEGILGRT
ncbi:major facilitator superfamily domain-containing protein [Lasiosphaeris hirsuta]|uniref:Major facilitator superfamily domain-containing protein n=1 Tax=Lasiosphaeris hirsuta TaxID=260670 RepID=A0AA40A126_9PEZI|nr:major facilitator superfamily domain-containing protein [Lasiosphaeris hirsuta]